MRRIQRWEGLILRVPGLWVFGRRVRGLGRMQGTVLWTLYREIGFLSVSGVPCVRDASWRSFHGSGFVREGSISTFCSLFHDCITFWDIEPSCISVVEILKITWAASVDYLELTSRSRGHGPPAEVGHFVKSLPSCVAPEYLLVSARARYWIIGWAKHVHFTSLQVFRLEPW